MAVTVRDIAKKLSVSPATVSIALNGKRGIGEETRSLVLEAAVEMGYNLDRVRGRKNGKTIRLLKIEKHGHILNRDHVVFISDYIDGLEQEARQFGYTLEVQSLKGLDYESIKADLKRAGLSGAAILATELVQEDILPFCETEIPIVFIDGIHPCAPFDFVDMDNEGAVYSIVNALYNRGHRNIGLVKSSMETKNFRSREENFMAALKDYGLVVRKDWIFSVDSTYDRSCRDMNTLLERVATMPSALFCVNDIIALGCLTALRNRGFSVPGDVSVIGFDDLPMSTMSDPPLASVKVSKSRIGRRAFQLLLRRIESAGPLPYEKVYIGSELVIRDSLGSVAVPQ